MKRSISLLLCAFYLQFIADFTFSLLSSNEAWLAGGFNDVMYLTAYFFGAYAILSIGEAINRIKQN